METRIKIHEIQPDAFKAMYALEGYVQKCGLDHRLYELIKIRVSQINGCAFCLDMHTRDARKLGETDQRMHLLNAWRETTLYAPEERAALAVAEEITNIQVRGVSDQAYQNAIHTLGEVQTAQVIMAAITINAWNRIGVSTQL